MWKVCLQWQPSDSQSTGAFQPLSALWLNIYHPFKAPLYLTCQGPIGTQTTLATVDGEKNRTFSRKSLRYFSQKLFFFAWYRRSWAPCWYNVLILPKSEVVVGLFITVPHLIKLEFLLHYIFLTELATSYFSDYNIFFLFSKNQVSLNVVILNCIFLIKWKTNLNPYGLRKFS